MDDQSRQRAEPAGRTADPQLGERGTFVPPARAFLSCGVLVIATLTLLVASAVWLHAADDATKPPEEPAKPAAEAAAPAADTAATAPAPEAPKPTPEPPGKSWRLDDFTKTYAPRELYGDWGVRKFSPIFGNGDQYF